jgi:hypothetical protein
VTESKIHMKSFVDTKHIPNSLIHIIGGVRIHNSYSVHRRELLILNLLICISQKSFPNSREQVSSKFGRRFRQVMTGFVPSSFPFRCYAVAVYSTSVNMSTTHPLTDSFPIPTAHFFAIDSPPKPLNFLQRYQK